MQKPLRLAAATALVLVPGASSVAAQDTPKEFYDGAVIRWIVPYDPGGGYDEYARLLEPFMEEKTGARIDIVNMPGAGGMRGATEVFNSPGDGLTIGIVNGSAMVTNQIAGIEGADYKVGQYNYLGRVVGGLRILTTTTESGIAAPEDLLDASEPFAVGATGLGGSAYVDAVIVGEALGIDQKVVHGFNSSGDVQQAMLRGDLQGKWSSLGSALSGLEDGDFQAILQSDRERSDLVPEVPSAFEYADAPGAREDAEEILTAWAALNSVGRPVAAPPGVPEDRLDFLRDAFEKAMNDPDLAKQAEKAGRELGFASGADMARIAKEASEMSPEVEKLFARAIRGEI